MLNTVYWVIVSYFLVNTLIKLLSLKLVNYYLSLRNDLPLDNKYNNCYLIIPFLNESNVIESSLDYFYELCQQIPGIRIVWVGTNREIEQLTQTRIISFIEKNQCELFFILINAPEARKYMAGQLNFAVEQIRSNFSNSTNTKFAFYNVDSRPNIVDIRKNFELLDTEEIVQQYGLYHNNLPQNPKNINDFIYQCTFYWQSSWALIFEVRNVIINKYIKSHTLKKFSYVVGHGLFITQKAISQIGLFSEVHQNEDMEYSVRIHNYKIPIALGYGFSRSDMPLNIRDYLKQQAVWSRGPMKAFSYKDFEKPQSKIYSCKLFLHFLYWMCEPLGWGILIFGSMFLGLKHFIIAELLVSIYSLSVLILPNKKVALLKKYPISFFIGSQVFLLLHGIGPLLAISNRLKELCGQEVTKFKTPKKLNHEIP